MDEFLQLKGVSKVSPSEFQCKDDQGNLLYKAKQDTLPQSKNIGDAVTVNLFMTDWMKKYIENNKAVLTSVMTTYNSKSILPNANTKPNDSIQITIPIEQIGVSSGPGGESDAQKFKTFLLVISDDLSLGF